MIRAQNLKISYADLLFDNISFILGNGEKVGLVGLNGTGKTTLMKIIAGAEKPDEGELILQNETVAYLPQIFSLIVNQNEEEVMLGEFLESLVDDHITELWKVDKLLGKLDFGEYDEFRHLNTFSPGQKMKLYLVKLLIHEPSVLLIDEPTNHLDISGILWLESFIKKFKGIIITISHDREFLNTVCTKIFEIDEKKLHVYEGNYNDFKIEKARRLEEREKEFELQERRRKKFDDMVKRIKRGPSGKQQAKMLKAARTRMEREVTKNEISQYRELKVKDVSLDGGVHRKKMVCKLSNVSFGYNKKSLILQEASLEVRGQEIVWLAGPNGIGKSTLFKVLTGELYPQSGTKKFGQNVDWAYFSQDQSHLPLNETVRNYVLNNADITHQKSFGLLEKFLFPKEIQDVQIKSLSPGQKARLSFMIFSLHEYQFLILDEPTNHLDIETKESIELALKDFKGAILLISHDRYFVESLNVDRGVTLEEGRVVEIHSKKNL